ncbi:MAG: hypothetical protein ACLFS5_11845, partial [Spirochaetaceae bacterium]
MQKAQNEGLGVLPWSPLRGRWLSGKYDRKHLAGPGRGLAVAEETGRTHVQVALNSLLRRPS